MSIEFKELGRSNALGMSLVTAEIGFDDSYPTGGEEIPATVLGMTKVHYAAIEPSGGYVFKFDYATHKIIAYRTGSVTPSGSVAAPVFSGSALGTHTHNLLVKGAASGGIDEALGIEGTDSLAKDAATDRTIVGADSATKGGIVAITAGTPAGSIAAPAFTGAATTAAVLAQVSAATDLSAITGVRAFFIGH
jgi:hypothetical protein